MSAFAWEVGDARRTRRQIPKLTPLQSRFELLDVRLECLFQSNHRINHCRVDVLPLRWVIPPATE